MKGVRIVSFAITAAILAGVSFWLAKTPEKPGNTEEKMAVTASFYPLAFLAETISGGKADIRIITPAGAEPHEYEPTARDIASIEQSRIVFLNGLGLEPWGENVKKTVVPSQTSLVFAGEGLDVARKSDPHVWLSPVLVRNMAEKIEAEFIKADPANEAFYRDNLLKLKGDLSVLDMEYRSGLSKCALRKIITSHEAFGYLALEYGFEEVPIAGISPDQEPSPKDLARISSLVKSEGVKHVFFESLGNPKFSETIARETGAETLSLDPIEGLTKEDADSGKNYFSLMRENLAHLQIALQCQK